MLTCSHSPAGMAAAADLTRPSTEHVDPQDKPGMAIKSALHGLQDPVPGDVGRQRPVPVGIAREDVFTGLDRIIAGASAGRLLARFDCLHRFAQQLASLDDRLVGRAEMLAAAIDDPAHAFLQGTVLLVDAVDAGVALGLLHLAVETVVVRPVLERTEGFRIDMQWTVAEAALEPVFRC